jgi:hypothetical protein
MPQRVVGANEVKGNDDATSERRLRGILRKVHVRITRERERGGEGGREREGDGTKGERVGIKGTENGFGESERAWTDSEKVKRRERKKEKEKSKD